MACSLRVCFIAYVCGALSRPGRLEHDAVTRATLVGLLSRGELRSEEELGSIIQKLLMKAPAHSWLSHCALFAVLGQWAPTISAQQQGAAATLVPGQTLMHQHVAIGRGQRTCGAWSCLSQCCTWATCAGSASTPITRQDAVQILRYSLTGLQALQQYEVRVSYAASVRCFQPFMVLAYRGCAAAAAVPQPRYPVQVPVDVSLRLQDLATGEARLRARSRR